MNLQADKESEALDGLIYFHPQELRTKDFNKFVDSMLANGCVDEGMFNSLTPVQMHVYSVLNRALARAMRLEADIE